MKVSTDIITSITACPIGLATILMIMSVSIIKTAIILYRFPQLLFPSKLYCSIVKLVEKEDLVDLLRSYHPVFGLALYSPCVVILIIDLLCKDYLSLNSSKILFIYFFVEKKFIFLANLIFFLYM